MIDASALPPRSTLCDLSPIGLGSSHAESLDGYIWRLSVQHWVPLSAVKTLILEGNSITRAKPLARRADLPSLAALRLTQRLPSLTLQPSTSRLGLGHLVGRLGPAYTLRRHRAWCCDCVAEMDDGTVYWPLVWNLEGYNYCSRHSCALRTRCPNCDSRFELTTSWLPLERTCFNCKRDVIAPKGIEDHSSGRPSPGTSPSHAEMALSAALERFVADVDQIPPMRPEAADSGIDMTLDHALRLGVAESSEDLATLIGLTPLFLERLRGSTGTPPNLCVLGRLSIASGVPIAGILYAHMWSADGIKVAAQDLQALPVAHGGNGYDVKLLKAAARSAIASGEQTDIVRLAKKFIMSSESLRRAIGPELTAELRDSGRLRRQAQTRQAYSNMVGSLATICRRLKAESVPISGLRVAREAGLFHESRRFMAAYREALQTLERGDPPGTA